MLLTAWATKSLREVVVSSAAPWAAFTQEKLQHFISVVMLLHSHTPSK